MNWADRIEEAIAEAVAVLHELAQFEIYSHMIPLPRRPAGEHVIRRYEQYLGMQLPPSYRTFLGMYNGFGWLAFPGHMLSVEDVSPGGEYWNDIREWKLGMAEAGRTDALDGTVIAYLDQPNNWACLDPYRADGPELAIALHVPGVDPDYFANAADFIRGSAGRARLARSWAEQQGERRV